MAIYQTAFYRVEESAIDDCKRAIKEFVKYVKANEPGTEMYMSWQQMSDPTSFVHLFKFKDKKAQEIHSQSKAVKKFESVYRPALLSDGVTFTDYELVASNS